MGFKAFDNNWFDIWILEECVRTQEARMEPKQSHEYCNESTPLTAHSQSVKLSYPQAPTDPDTMRWIGDINTRGALNNSSNIDSQSIQVFGLAIVLDPAPPRSKQLIAASIGQSLVAGKHCTACVSLDLPEMGRSESWVGIRLLFAVMVVTVLCVLAQVSVAQQQYASSGVGAIVTRAMFDDLWPNRNASFYTYAAFIAAAKCYPKFGTEGTQAQKLREIAAFAAHVQQETAGLYYINEIDQSNSYCDSTNTQYPCAPGQKYFGRGPLQLSWNFNYGAASRPVGYNILADPGQVAKDPILAFKSSLWFWNTASGSEPSIHNVLVGKWIPSAADISANRTVGFGVTIDIINGYLECGKTTAQASNRVKYFKQFASQLGVDPGQNLDCANMKPF